jgi:hypothetical protein
MRGPPKLDACTACKSTSLIFDVWAVDRGDGNSKHAMLVAKNADPDAIFFKGRKTSGVTAVVCRSCGLIHYFATDPDSIAV